MVSPEEGDTPSIVLLHCNTTDEPDKLHRVQTLRGQVGSNAIAAADRRAWIVYQGSDRASVQVVTSEPPSVADPPGPRAYISSARAPLPVGEGLRSFAAASEHAWALLRIETATMLTDLRQTLQTDATPRRVTRERDRRLNVAIGLPAGMRENEPKEPQPSPLSDESRTGDTASEPSTETADDQATSRDSPPATPDAADPIPMPTDVLLEWSRGAWREVALPEDWPTGQPAKLVALRSTASDPVLVVEVGQKTDRQAWVYRRADGKWKSASHPRRADSTVFDVVTVSGQLVLAERSSENDRVAVALSVLRRNEATDIGTLAIDGPADRPWAMASIGDAAALIVQDHPLAKADDEPSAASLRWTRMNLLGDVVTPPTDLDIVRVSIYDMAGGSVVLVSVLVLATLMMLLFWRRDPRSNQVILPDAYVLAGFLRRAGAGAIDLAPGVLGVMFFFDLGFDELIARRPGSAVAMTWESMQPGAIVIVVFLLHTIVTECLTMRTLGKACVGLRVTRLDGTRPKFWQLLVRGLLKAFDLIAWLLLILPLIGPFRQRLGDMVARTVVIQKAPAEEQDTGDGDDE